MKNTMKHLLIGLIATIGTANAQFPGDIPQDWIQVSTGLGTTFSQMTGFPAAIQLPPQLVTDPFSGAFVSQFPFVSEFVISVGPGSQARGCQLVTNNPQLTGVSPANPVALGPTRYINVSADARPGRMGWKQYHFSVNNGQGAQLLAIQTTYYQTTFPTTCMYEVLYRNQQSIFLGALSDKPALHPSGLIRNEEPPKAFAAAAPRAVDPKAEATTVIKARKLDESVKMDKVH